MAMVPNGMHPQQAPPGAGGAAPRPPPRPGRGPPAPEPGATWCRRAARAVRQRLQDAQQLFREYQYVVALDDTIRHSQGDAMRSESAQRNRYANVLPYDYNRWGGARCAGARGAVAVGKGWMAEGLGVQLRAA